MPKLEPQTKELIKNLSQDDLQHIVLKLAAKEKLVYDYILVNYIDKEQGEKDLYFQTKSDLDKLIRKNYRGYSQELQLANMLSACIKRVNEFSKVSKNKKLEADLLMYILQTPFSLTTGFFGTCFSIYDTKVALIIQRLITIITKKLHQDYKIEYSNDINKYLQILHRTSSHISTVSKLPKEI